MMLELKNVDKRYGKGAVGAVDVNMSVEPGSMVALFGPSGSGKTSILHMMGLLQQPDSGEIWLDGVRIDGLAERQAAEIRSRDLGFVFQSFGLLPLLSARENVGVTMRLLGVGGEAARSRVRTAMEAVGIDHRAQHRPSEMSGGEQQRAAIARALVHSPKLILADEPTGELDSSTARLVLELLHGVAEQGGTVVIATHDPIALEIVDTAYFVRDGRLHVPGAEELQLWLTEGEGTLAAGRCRRLRSTGNPRRSGWGWGRAGRSI